MFFYRFVTDFKKARPPIQRLLDCIDRIGNAKHISVFDCLKGYWQLPLTDRARKVSAFCTPRGLSQYKLSSSV